MPRLFAVLLLTSLASTVLAADGAPRRTLPIGIAAPQLQLRMFDGSPTPTWQKELRGKVVIVDFWASWCGPCVGAIDHLDALKKELASEPVVFLSITYEPRAKTMAFLAKHPMTTAVAMDEDLTTFTSFIAWGIPMTYLVGVDGRIAAVVNPTRLTAADIRAVLDGKTPAIEQHPGWSDPIGAEKYFRVQLAEDRKNFGER